MFKGTPVERLKSKSQTSQPGEKEDSQGMGVIVIFDVFDTKKSGVLDRKGVSDLVDTVFTLYYQESDRPKTKHLVEKLFNNLDKNKEGRLSFAQFESALLVEPKLARCFLPASGNRSRVNSEKHSGDEGVFGLLPVLSETAPKKTPVTNFRSRSDIIDSLPSEMTNQTRATDSSLNIATDSGSCCTLL